MEILPITARPEDVLREVLSALASGALVALATVVARHGSAPATPGQKLALIDRGPASEQRELAFGTVGGGAIERVVLIEMKRVLGDRQSTPKLHTFRLGPNLGMCCGGSAEVLIEPMRPAECALIVGAGHVGLATAPLLAGLGFRVILVDARQEAGTDQRVGDLGSVRFIAGDYDDAEVLEAVGDPANASCVVMTHDHQLDQRVIEWAIARRFRFVGGVGSRAKAERSRQRLEAKGVPEADRARVRMPVGLEIGARRPAEIAVAIAAELIRLRAAAEGLARSALDSNEGREAPRSKPSAKIDATDEPQNQQELPSDSEMAAVVEPPLIERLVAKENEIMRELVEDRS